MNQQEQTYKLTQFIRNYLQMEFPFNTEKSTEKSHLRPPDFASASTRWKIATGTTENRRKNQTSSGWVQRITGRESRVLGFHERRPPKSDLRPLSGPPRSAGNRPGLHRNRTASPDFGSGHRNRTPGSMLMASLPSSSLFCSVSLSVSLPL